MNIIFWLIIITCITGIGSGAIGASLALVFNMESKRTTALLLGFASGLMLAIICFDFIPEAIELDESMCHLLLVIFVILLGVGIVGILSKIMQSRMEKKAHCCAIDDPELSKYIDEKTKAEHLKMHEEQERAEHSKAGVAHSHAQGVVHEHLHSHGIDYEGQDANTLKLAGVVMAIAIALHNLPAGMSIGASFAAADGSMIISGITIAILIGVHSIPESMAMAIPFLHSGKSRTKTILIACLVGAVVVLGAIAGFALGEIDMFWLAMSLAFASGAMLYVIFGEMLPDAFELYHSKKLALAIVVGMLLGLILIAL